MPDGLHIILQHKPTSPEFYAVYVLNGMMRTGHGRTTIEAAANALQNWINWFGTEQA